ncbi:MAG: hypothetical protein ACFHWZ_10380 [Phycisphaerales bacterium]
MQKLVDLPEDVTPRGQIETQKLAGKPPVAMATTRRWLTEIEGLDKDGPAERALARRSRWSGPKKNASAWR